jgi:hypothetical protein
MRMNYRMMDIIRWDSGWLDQNWGDKLWCLWLWSVIVCVINLMLRLGISQT